MSAFCFGRLACLLWLGCFRENFCISAADICLCNKGRRGEGLLIRIGQGAVVLDIWRSASGTWQSCVQGTTCNMARPGDVAALANFARDKLGGVDLWCANQALYHSFKCTLCGHGSKPC